MKSVMRGRSGLSLVLGAIVITGIQFVLISGVALGQSQEFNLHEVTIKDIHGAIQAGRITCQGVVQEYINRAKAYNGVCTQLVSQDGAPTRPATGYVRAGSPLVFPTETLSAMSFLPDFDQYQGLPLDLGRMEPTASDPSVEQQFGMISGMPNAGQLNALETINIRGERSVTCKAQCDMHPSSGALPASCPSVCKEFRRQPDALERAAELDAQYGTNPDLSELPLYCTTFSIKDWYDIKDMRSTGGNDVAFAMDAAPEDSTIVANLRDKGAIIYAVSIANELRYNADGPAKPKKLFIGEGGLIKSSWGGHVCNPYDTERSAGPSSGGAGTSVAANLVTCAICETTGGSCREPADQNAVASFVTTKGLTSETGTATAQFMNHRPGVLCRTLADAAHVLDSIRNPERGYFDSRDMFTAIPKTLLSNQPYALSIVDEKDLEGEGRPLEGMRVGIVREFMVKHTLNDVAISDQIDNEIKKVLRDKLGAEIVESVDPKYPDDPTVSNMKYTFQDAFAEIIAFNAPEYFFQTIDGDLEFAVPGYDVRTRDYMVQLALGQAPLSDKLNMRRILSRFDNTQRTAFSVDKYLRERGDTRVTDWVSYVANSKWRSELQAVGAQNAAKLDVQDIRATQGSDRVKMQSVFRLAVLKVMHENDIDVFVHPNVGVPQWKIGIDREPTIDNRRAAGPAITDLLGVPEIIIPAGYNQIVYDPRYVLSEDKRSYSLATGTVQSLLPHPMPISINFWAGPGDEATVLKVASSYEAATKHRVPPPAFGPLPDEP